ATGEVVARIGLGVAELPRLAHGVAERAAVFERGHQVSEGSRKTPEDLLDAIAGLLELRERVENRKSRAGGRFVAQREAAIFRGLHQAIELDLRDGERLLVREHDVEALLERFLDQRRGFLR